MRGTFRKISRVGTLTGATKWYLSDDCLLAAKRVMYAVEYRRFYLRDLESIVVWPRRAWIARPISFGASLGVIGILVWNTSNLTAGAVVWGIGLGWVLLEFALGPTAESRIRTTGTTVDLALVKRTRRARRVLDTIEGAVRAARGDMIEQSASRTEGLPQSSVEASPEPTPTGAGVADLT